MQRTGLVTHWNEARGFGFISVTRAERYYFHVSQVIEGPAISLFGLTVTFEMDPTNPPKPGNCPQAVNVHVVAPTVAPVEPKPLTVKGGAR